MRHIGANYCCVCVVMHNFASPCFKTLCIQTTLANAASYVSIDIGGCIGLSVALRIGYYSISDYQQLLCGCVCCHVGYRLIACIHEIL